MKNIYKFTLRTGKRKTPLTIEEKLVVLVKLQQKHSRILRELGVPHRKPWRVK